jgi:hypothetical protein
VIQARGKHTSFVKRLGLRADGLSRRARFSVRLYVRLEKFSSLMGSMSAVPGGAIATRWRSCLKSYSRLSLAKSDIVPRAGLARWKRPCFAHPFFELGGEPVVLDLQKLSREEQRAVLAAPGMGATEAEALLSEAEERGLADFLENPQNLILLHTAVRAGEWPQTRAALFELATAIMLREENAERAQSGKGAFSVAQLRPVAGAVFATRLISDIEAVSLKSSLGYPSKSCRNICCRGC